MINRSCCLLRNHSVERKGESVLSKQSSNKNKNHNHNSDNNKKNNKKRDRESDDNQCNESPKKKRCDFCGGSHDTSKCWNKPGNEKSRPGGFSPKKASTSEDKSANTSIKTKAKSDVSQSSGKKDGSSKSTKKSSNAKTHSGKHVEINIGRADQSDSGEDTADKEDMVYCGVCFSTNHSTVNCHLHKERVKNLAMLSSINGGKSRYVYREEPLESLLAVPRSSGSLKKFYKQLSSDESYDGIWTMMLSSTSIRNRRGTRSKTGSNPFGVTKYYSKIY